MLKFTVAGWSRCGAFAQAKNAMVGLSVLFPSRITVNVNEHETRDEYMDWLMKNRDDLKAPEHKTSPLVYSDDFSFVGGRDDVLSYCRRNLAGITGITAAPVSASTASSTGLENVDNFNPDHNFTYDLVVIGGGSGGLAASKEAARLGARVAVLDYVKPSPQGSTWGLGGTCVNVGCIPKKLMHHASVMGEHAQHAAEFGWKGGELPTHDWDVLRDNVQDHIKGLNFGYKVALRDNGVKYLNKLGSFVGPNELQVVDKKGKSDIISAARFIIATGGRPTLPDCPGAEHVVTSDDLFMLQEKPGKTCVIGAGYVALECAGFITGLKQGEVTVLVRSVPLRGFDRDLVEKVTDYMTATGTNIKTGVTPTKIEKIPGVDGGRDQFRVTLSNGESDVYDTVLAAMGRRADTDKLGLDSLGVKINPANGKIIASNEQTSVPHIYAIGDVVDKTPELTPVAIMAGRKLARRLMPASGNSSGVPDYMDYDNIATTVFTPLEMGTVGLSEDAANAKYGEEAVDSFISYFTPLETALQHPDGNPCIAKVVVNTMDNNRVLGMHIASPNAGEIIQGFGVAMKKGLTLEELNSVVGIHPTCAEELVDVSVSKKSGVDANKSGC